MTATRRLLAAATVVAALMTMTAPAPAEPDRPARVAGQVLTVAGIGEEGYSGDRWRATRARLGGSLSVAVGPDGSVHIADALNKRLRRVDPDGVIDTVPGTRATRSPETDGPEHNGLTYSPSNAPLAAAVAEDGTVYLAGAQDIRRIDPNGGITVLTGGGELDFTDGDGGDGGPATEAWIHTPNDIAVDGEGNVLVADATNGRIRRIDARGVIDTVAGGGNLAPEAAEGKPATSADLGVPARVAVDDAGTVYFSQENDTAVHRVGRDGTLALVADVTTDGGRIAGLAVDADGVPHVVDQSRGVVLRIGTDGTTTQVGPRLTTQAQDLAVGPDGDVYVAGGATVVRLVLTGEDTGDAAPTRPARSRWADDEPGTVHTVAGTGRRVDAAPVAAPVERPPGGSGIAVGPDGGVYVAEPAANRVRRIDRDGTVSTVAGGEQGREPRTPQGVAVDADGTVYVAETGGDRISRVDADGAVSTFAAVPAPRDVAVDHAGTVYATAGERVHRFDARGEAVPVAGGGERWADDADGAPAGEARLWEPDAVAVGPDSTVYLVEHDRPAVRAVRPDGILVTVAGDSYRSHDEGGFAGDGGPATRAELNTPSGLAVGPDGSRYVADTYNNRVRRIDRDGTITTVAGTGERADDGDGGPATEAALTEPAGVAVGPDGALYVTGLATSRVRRIAPDGTISTIADLAPAAEDERATDVDLGHIHSLAVGVDGALYLTDAGGGLRTVARDGTTGPAVADPTGRGHRGGILAAGPDGSLYLGQSEVVRRGPDGTSVVVAGGGFAEGRDRPATEASIQVGDLATGPDGELYLRGRESVLALRDGRLVEVLGDAGPLGGSRSDRTERCTRSPGTGCSR